MTIQLGPTTIDDDDAVIALLLATSGVSLRDADSGAATARYLDRSPGLSSVTLNDADVADGETA